MSGLHTVRLRLSKGHGWVEVDGKRLNCTRIEMDTVGPGETTLVTVTIPCLEVEGQVDGAWVKRQVDPHAVLDALVPEGVRRKVEGQ